MVACSNNQAGIKLRYIEIIEGVFLGILLLPDHPVSLIPECLSRKNYILGQDKTVSEVLVGGRGGGGGGI